MQNLPGIPLGEQTRVQSVSDAVSKHIISDIHALRSEDGAGLFALLDDAIMQGIDHALSLAARAHATAVLEAERSARASGRAGYRSGQRTVRVAGPLGVMNVALIESCQGLLRPDFLKDAGRLTEGVKQLALRLWTHKLSYKSISSVSAEDLKSQGRPFTRRLLGSRS